MRYVISLAPPMECMALSRCFSVRLLPVLLFHLFITTSSLHSIYIDLNGLETAKLDNQAEWLERGGAVPLATSSAVIINNKTNDTTLSGCLAVSSDNTLIAREIQMNISSESGLAVNFSNSTLKICHRNSSHYYSLQLLTSVIRRVTFDCWVNCMPNSTRTFNFFICYRNGSRSVVSKSEVWMTSRPMFNFIDDPSLTFERGKQCLALFGSASVAIQANRRMGVQSIHLTLLNSLDAPHEALTVINMSTVNTSVIHKNGTVILSIVFPAATTHHHVISTIQLIRYCNNKAIPSSGIRFIAISISNGQLFSNQSIISINILHPNNTKLEIIHIPDRKYWQASPSSVLQLAEMASLRRSDPNDLAPVYAGHVKYQFMSPEWIFNPLTNLNCSVHNDPIKKLKSCVKVNPVMIIDLHEVSPFHRPSSNVVDGVQRYIYNTETLTIPFSTDVVHQLPWSISFWFHCGSRNSHLLISKFMTPIKEGLIYEIDVQLDRSLFTYNLSTDELVNVTFLVPFQLDTSLWHHFVFVAGKLNVQAFVDGQILDVENITSQNMSQFGSDLMSPPPLMDQSGYLNVSVANVTTQPVMLAGFIMVDKPLSELQAKCVAGCEEQLYINTDIIPYNLIKQLKPVLSGGGQVVSLSGPASLDAYTALLQSLGYVSFSPNPDKSPRNITFYVSDMMYTAHHHMQLIHACNATEKCGNALNISCEMVDSLTHLCVCPPTLIYDTKLKSCGKQANCTKELCGNHSSCNQISETSVSCECISGFKKDWDSGSNCLNINDCIGNVCNNKGTCVDGIGSYSCLCPWNYTGLSCETPIDICLSNPCIHGHCENNKCVCDPGYNGSHCMNYVGCLGIDCLNGGRCEIQDGRYKCLCLSQFYGPICQFNSTESTSTLTIAGIIGIGVSSSLLVIIVVFVAVFWIMKQRRKNNLLVEGHRRQRFTYSQYLGESRSNYSRKYSKKSYSFVNQKRHNHMNLEKDHRAAVRRLSVSFGDNMRQTGSVNSEMATAGLFRPVSGINTQIFGVGTALPDIDTPLQTINSSTKDDHNILTTQQEIQNEEDGDDNMDAMISNMFATVIENDGIDDSNDNESENISEPETNNPLPDIDIDEPINEGLLTPGQIRARKIAIEMLSSFRTDNLSDSD